MWSYLAGLVVLYVIFELLIPKKKWYVMCVYIILTIIYFSFLLIDPHNNVRITHPRKPGEDLIEDYVIFGSPVFITSIIMVCSIVIFGGFGIYFKSIKSLGILKKKLRYLSIGNTINILLIAIWPVFGISIFTFLYRIGLICNFWFFYIALREDPIEPQKKPRKKEIMVEESLFRISERPDYISEEEVTYYKEQELCLVCKGRVDRINYICPQCRVLYCLNCYHAISDLENACWVCDTPIDPSKPVKISKKEEEVEVLESEKDDKSKKINKIKKKNKRNTRRE
jgi:hypothetical protein